MGFEKKPKSPFPYHFTGSSECLLIFQLLIQILISLSKKKKYLLPPNRGEFPSQGSSFSVL